MDRLARDLKKQLSDLTADELKRVQGWLLLWRSNQPVVRAPMRAFEATLNVSTMTLVEANPEPQPERNQPRLWIRVPEMFEFDRRQVSYVGGPRRRTGDSQ